jgi:uncharacterized protein (DUF1778 family)
MQNQLRIERDNQLVLSSKDSEIFFEAIKTPPVPSQKLKTALKAYREIIIFNQSYTDQHTI